LYRSRDVTFVYTRAYVTSNITLNSTFWGIWRERYKTETAPYKTRAGSIKQRYLQWCRVTSKDHKLSEMAQCTTALRGFTATAEILLIFFLAAQWTLILLTVFMFNL